MENEVPSELVAAVAEEIVAYVRENSAVGDSPQGIWRWWLTDRRDKVDLAIVEQALRMLVAQGRLGMRVLASGTTHYVGLEANKRPET